MSGCVCVCVCVRVPRVCACASVCVRLFVFPPLPVQRLSCSWWVPMFPLVALFALTGLNTLLVALCTRCNSWALTRNFAEWSRNPYTVRV